MEESKYGEFELKDNVLDYICEQWDIFEGEGLDEAYKAFMKLPIRRRTKSALDYICKNILPADIDPNDDDYPIPKV